MTAFEIEEQIKCKKNERSALNVKLKTVEKLLDRNDWQNIDKYESIPDTIEPVLQEFSYATDYSSGSFIDYYVETVDEKLRLFKLVKTDFEECIAAFKERKIKLEDMQNSLKEQIRSLDCEIDALQKQMVSALIPDALENLF